ncbi:unnamed protein product [Bursaphelenchus xylophilus]|uniref:(pine wood nematode) hypothetical protein n=1 Tax=Bursaphelenchus xylophilus TaxID=6326 RepID=A0A1I7RX09_BURXY|nr:unnamed protein product [Bursaphelenchus xylophilus]CAG9121251.1 unnamed protein product [Bursaphelenchus xylophilus]
MQMSLSASQKQMSAGQHPETWIRIIEHADAQSQVELLKAIKILQRFVSAEELKYRRLCFRNHIYRLKGETWKEAFESLGSRALVYPKIANSWDLKSTKVLFCDDSDTGRFALADDCSAVVTSFDLGANYRKLIAFKYPLGVFGETSLISQGDRIVCYHPQPGVVCFYDVDREKLVRETPFPTEGTLFCNGSLLNLQTSTFLNGFDMTTKRLHGAEIDSAEAENCTFKCVYRKEGDHRFILENVDNGTYTIFDTDGKILKELSESKSVSLRQLYVRYGQIMTISRTENGNSTDLSLVVCDERTGESTLSITDFEGYKIVSERVLCKRTSSNTYMGPELCVTYVYDDFTRKWYNRKALLGGYFVRSVYDTSTCYHEDIVIVKESNGLRPRYRWYFFEVVDGSVNVKYFSTTPGQPEKFYHNLFNQLHLGVLRKETSFVDV